MHETLIERPNLGRDVGKKKISRREERVTEAASLEIPFGKLTKVVSDEANH